MATEEDRSPDSSSILKSGILITSKLDESLHFFAAAAGFPLSIWKDSIHKHITRQASPNSLELSSTGSSISGVESAVTGTGGDSGCFVMPPFTPYSAKVPWHTGSRAILSQIFPKYGNYCGPNWSSGRHKGSLVWDVAPVDWLDFCCFKHDVGYDSHSQEELYKADLELLDCLMRMPKEKLTPQNRGGIVREFYRNVCILGLRRVLIPYRRMILSQQRRLKSE